MTACEGKHVPVRRPGLRHPQANKAKLTLAALSAAISLTAAAADHARAADGTWNGLANDGLWQTPGNWEANIVPGGNGGATGTNTDTATFLTNPPPPVTDPPTTWTFVAVDANRNVKNLNFASTTLSFRLGTDTRNAGNTLYLSDGGVAENTGNAAGVPGDVYAPVQFTGATYTFLNNNTNAAALRFLGDVVARPGGGTVLTVDGTHGILSSSQAEINGAMIDNPAGGVLSVVKNGSGTWEVNTPGSRPSTYSGDTIINGGVLRASMTDDTNGLGGFSPNSHYIVNTGAALRNSVAGSTVRRITLNFGGSLLASSTTGSTINIQSNAGPALLMDFDQPTDQNFVRVRIPINLTGTVADEGGITLLAAPGASGTGLVEIGDPGSAFDMGTVRRAFDIGRGADANTDYDLRVRGAVSGSGGMVKKGAGTLRFDHTANPFTGQIEIQQGTFILNANDSLTGLPALLVNGGAMRLKGDSTQRFGAVTVKKGAIEGANNNAVVFAPSYTFDVAAGDTANVDVVMSDAVGGPSPLVKNGAGATTIELAPAHTGSTTVNAGTLALTTSMTSSPSVNVTGGTLELRPSNTELNRVIKTGTVSITGTGRLDLARNKLITSNTPVGTATTVSGNTRLYDGLQGMVQRAKNGDAWDGPGLTSDDAATSGGLTTIGIATGAQAKGGIGATETALWGGQTITGSDILAMYTYAGDANLDGAITGDDYSAIDFGILFEGMDGYANGDFNYDGFVTGDDYSVIDLNILLQGPQIPTGGSASSSALSGVTAVPEPSACGFALLAAAATVARRRRRRRRDRVQQDIVAFNRTSHN